MTLNYKVSGIFIYPIKSLGALSLTESVVDNLGLQYDRNWMLVDENNRFLSQREIPEMCKFKVKNHNLGFEITHADYPSNSLVLEIENSPTKSENVTIWEDKISASILEEKYHKWFTQMLGVKCKLVKINTQSKRFVDPKYALNKEITAFADGFPIMMIGEESLNDLNAKLVKPILMDRFRPNIVFSGGLPFDEDAFSEIKINDAILKGVKPCSRCQVVTVNQQSASIGPEPLKTLATYRKFNNHVMFGQNALVLKTGVLKLNDKIILS